MTKNFFAVAALVALASSAVGAQGTDHGSSLGTGAGASGSIANFMPGASGGPAAVNTGGMGSARGSFLAATGAGVPVQNPAGGTVVVPAAAAQALGAVLNGSPTPAQSQAATAAFGGHPAAAALTTALQALGANPTPAALVAAVEAYNAAVTSSPGNAPPTPALLAARQALAAAMQP